MATVRQFFRTYGAAVRRSERAQQRRAREAAMHFKLQAKVQEIANATEAVKQYDDYISLIKSVHKNCTEPVSWDAILSEPRPVKPSSVTTRQEKAKKALDTYTPSFYDKIFRINRSNALREKLAKAIIEDAKETEALLKVFGEEDANWLQLISIAQNVKANSPEAYKATLEYFRPFEDLHEIGSQITLSFSPDIVEASIKIKGADIIPAYSLSQTATGKLAKKDLPQSKFNELYQDYVCSVGLRVARELLAYFPIKFVVINAVSEVLSTTTGQYEDQILLSVVMPPETLCKLNLDNIDPSDSMKNFIHNMKFSKSTGFSVVKPVDIKKLISSQ